MNIAIREEQGAWVLQVTGRMDAVSSTDFDKTCQAQLEKGAKKMVLDLTHLEYISSAGLRSMLSLAKRLKTGGGSLALCNLNGIVKEVVTVSGFDQILPIFANVADALK